MLWSTATLAQTLLTSCSPIFLEAPPNRAKAEGEVEERRRGRALLVGFRGLWGIFWSRACRENGMFQNSSSRFGSAFKFREQDVFP